MHLEVAEAGHAAAHVKYDKSQVFNTEPKHSVLALEYVEGFVMFEMVDAPKLEITGLYLAV